MDFNMNALQLAEFIANISDVESCFSQNVFDADEKDHITIEFFNDHGDECIVVNIWANGNITISVNAGRVYPEEDLSSSEFAQKEKEIEEFILSIYNEIMSK